MEKLSINIHKIIKQNKKQENGIKDNSLNGLNDIYIKYSYKIKLCIILNILLNIFLNVIKISIIMR